MITWVALVGMETRQGQGAEKKKKGTCTVERGMLRILRTWSRFEGRRGEICQEDCIEEKEERKRLRLHFTRIIAQGLFWTSTCSNQFIIYKFSLDFFQQCINNSRD